MSLDQRLLYKLKQSIENINLSKFIDVDVVNENWKKEHPYIYKKCVKPHRKLRTKYE